MNDSWEPSLDELTGFVLGDLEVGLAQRIQGKIDQNPIIAVRVESLRRVLAGVRDAGTLSQQFEVSRESLERLKRIPNITPAPSARPSLGEIVASLLFDTRELPLAGFRAEPGSVDRMLRFEFESGTIDVRMHEDTNAFGRFWLHGDAMALAGATVALVRQDAEIARTEVDATGYFEFNVEAGPHALRFQLGKTTIVIDSLNVGEE